MRRNFKSLLGATALLTVAASSASAAGLTANGQLTTDYVLRGISQTANRPAVQGGVDYDTGFGVTAGTWFSSLDFGDDTPLEWDIYGQYNFMLGPVNLGIGGIGYVYPYAGHFGPYDYFEFTANAGYDFGIAQWSAKVWYDPFDLPKGFFDIKGVHPKTEYYLQTGLTVPVVSWFSLSGNIGYEGYSGTGTTNYTEWDVGGTFTYDHYSLDLRYLDTSEHASFGPWFKTGPFYVATFTFRFP